MKRVFETILFKLIYSDDFQQAVFYLLVIVMLSVVLINL